MQLTQQDQRPVETRIDPLTGRVVDVRPDVGDFDAPTEVVTPAEARQGGLGRPVLMVLVAALVLGAIYVLATTLWAVDEQLPPSGEVAPVNERVTPPAPTNLAPTPVPTPTPVTPAPAPATPPAAGANPAPAPAPAVPPAGGPTPAPAPAPGP